MGEEVYGRKWKETLMFEIALKCVHCLSLATSGLLEMRTVSSYKDKCLQVYNRKQEVLMVLSQDTFNLFF
jgi:hypothetical protein